MFTCRRHRFWFGFGRTLGERHEFYRRLCWGHSFRSACSCPDEHIAGRRFRRDRRSDRVRTSTVRLTDAFVGFAALGAAFPPGRVEEQPLLLAPHHLQLTMESRPAGLLDYISGGLHPGPESLGRDRLRPSLSSPLGLPCLSRQYRLRPTATAPTMRGLLVYFFDSRCHTVRHQDRLVSPRGSCRTPVR